MKCDVDLLRILDLIIKTKRDDNKSFLNDDEYIKRLAEVKEAKTFLLFVLFFRIKGIYDFILHSFNYSSRYLYN